MILKSSVQNPVSDYFFKKIINHLPVDYTDNIYEVLPAMAMTNGGGGKT